MHNAYIFIGQSGAGKGTQVSLLKEKFEQLNDNPSILLLATGNIFREFAKSTSYTAQKTKTYMDEGILPPPFIGIHVWSHELINRYDGQQYVIMDGAPRVPDEVPVLLSAARFYNWKTHVVFLNVSDQWAEDRLIGRGRADDVNEQERKERLSWYHDNVMPAVQLLRNASDVHFIDVNGEQPIEKVHEDICAALNL